MCLVCLTAMSMRQTTQEYEWSAVISLALWPQFGQNILVASGHWP